MEKKHRHRTQSKAKLRISVKDCGENAQKMCEKNNFIDYIYPIILYIRTLGH